MKGSKFCLNFTSVVCFIYGALYCFSLVFIPIGVYCFVAGRKFSYKADHLLDSVAVTKKTMLAYTIFASIACFPFGLVVIFAYFGLYGNNVQVQSTTIEEQNSDEQKQETTEEKPTTHDKQEETEEEKLEKLEKLEKFREKGIISEEEFEMAKEQMFGKDKK